MKVYKLKIDLDEAYYWYQYVKEKSSDLKMDTSYIVAYNQSFISKIPQVYGEKTIHKTFKVIADISRFQGTLGFMVNDKVYKCLRTIEEDIEFIPVIFKDDSVAYLLYVREVHDAFDYDKMMISEYIEGPKGKFPKTILKYSFKKDVIENVGIFRQQVSADTYDSQIYVSDKFKEIIQKNNFTGVEFEEVWDSEE